MALPDLTGINIEDTYQRVLHTDGTNIYDGTGSLFTATAVAAPAGPDKSVQFRDGTATSGSGNFTFDKSNNSMILTGSMITTGSNALIGTTTLTGSLNVSGSTTQVGNNTLQGNTLLSGSIIISGALSQPNPTISIFGDLNQTGYTRYLPVVTNLDTSLSASYIYVSGSTQDLYFSQNSKGYANTTRLRWLEGNLYTGIFNGGLITQVNSNTYQVGSGSGVIVALNASFNDNPYPTTQYINWDNLTHTIDALSASFDQQFVAINSSSAIFAQGIPYTDGDYNTKIPIGIVIHQNHSSINAVQTFPSVAYGWKQRSFDFIKAFGPLKISGYTLSPSGSSTRGLVLSGGVSWVDGRNYIIDLNNPSYITEATGIVTSKIYRYYQSGSDWGYNTNGGAGYTDIDPTQYSNNGTLTLVGTNDWTLQRVFYFPNSATKAFYIYYGNATYSSKDNAIAGILTEQFSEAPNTAANAIFVGYMILRNNANFTTAASYEFRAAGLFRSSGIGGGGGGGTTSPGGSNTQIQYNNNGAFGGVTNLTWDGTTLYATGSFTGSFTGSLLGTASYATTASYALNGGVTQILAGSNISLSPTNGLGQVTISSTGGGSGGNTATGSYGSFYDTTIQSIGTVGAVYSMSLNNAPISNGVSLSGSTNPYNTYIKMANAGVYDIQFSAQLDKTTGTSGLAYIWLRKNGLDLPETNTVATLAGGVNDKAVAAWNWFVDANAGDYFQIVWAATNNNIRLYATGSGAIDAAPAIPSLIVTANRIDQFLSNTGSFSGSFTGQLIGTASWATNALTASYVTGSIFTNSNSAASASYALSSSYALSASYTDSASYSLSSSYASSSSYTLSSSYALSSSYTVSSSYSLSSSYAFRASYALSSSYANSSSYAASASYAATASNILGGKAPHIPYFITDTTLATSSIYQSGSDSIIINSDTNTTANPEALYVQQIHPTSFNVISGKGNLDNYLQLNIHNTNTGTAASSDVVATSNNGDENGNYIDMGINSSNFTGPVGNANDAYLYTTGSHLHIGNASPNKPIQFFAGGFDTDANRKFELNPNNQHNMTGSLDISGSLAVRGLTSANQANVVTIDASTGQLYYTASSAFGGGSIGVTQILTGSGISISPTNGIGVVTISSTGGSGGDFVTTSSFNTYTGSNASTFAGTSATASYSDNFIIGSTLTLDSTITDYSAISSTSPGPNNLFTLNTGSFTSAFGKYTIYNGSNSRAGEFVTSWNGTTVSYYDNSTVDIGNTSAITFTSAIVLGQIQINTGASTPSGWQVKMLATFM